MKSFFDNNMGLSSSTCELIACNKCKMYKKCKSPKMPYGGKGKQGILCVGEAPGRKEDLKGDQFVGETGSYLESVLYKCDIDLHEDCFKDNAVRCRPINKSGRNRTPSDREIGLCSGNVKNTIKKTKPKKIILLGECAVKSVIGGRGLSIGRVSKWTGWAIPDQEYGCWIFPTYHPSYIYRNMDNEVITDYFYNTIRNAIEWDKKFPNWKDEKSKPTLFFEPRPVIDFLEYLNNNPSEYPIAIDYETSGLKPYVEGHYIRCMSISIGPEKSISFPMFDDEIFKDRLQRVLTNPRIKKIAHNCLKGNTKVLMADGTQKNIKYLVDNNITDKVMCYDDNGNIVFRKITRHYKNIKNPSHWYKIRIKTKKNRGNYPFICCTNEHKIYTDRGRVKAENLRNNDKLLYVGGANDDLKSIIIGSLLGDGNFVKNKGCIYMNFYHCEKQKTYLLNLRNYFINCGFNCTNIFHTKQCQLGFRVKANSYFREIYNKFDKDYCIENLDLLSLSKWYMDDGSLTVYNRKKKDTFSIRIACKHLNRVQAENVIKKIYMLTKCLFLIDFYDNEIKGIRLGTKQSILFLRRIQSYMWIGGKDLYYKNPYLDQYSQRYNLDTSKTYFKVSIDSIEKKEMNKSQSNYNARYDIEIDEYHNYIANGVKVSNCKYEDTWTSIVLGYNVKGWIWDTMLTAHVLDNRPGITSLKMQTYLNYGTIGYDNKISKYLDSNSKDDNAFNKVGDAPLPELLLYCGMDTMFTHRLYLDQVKQMDPYIVKGNDLLLQGVIELASVERNGIQMDVDYFSRYSDRLAVQIKNVLKDIHSSEEVKEWEIHSRIKFNPASPDHLKKLLFNILDYKSVKETKKGNISVDEEVLLEINSGFTKDIVKLSKLSKIKDTFIEGFLRETRNFIIHPFFNLNSVRTFRSSSNSPNWQNIPKHDKRAQKIIRTGVIPRPDRLLLEVDYSAMEVKTAACVNKDPQMLYYCRTPGTDMHRDEAMKLFFVTAEQITKVIRFIAKNNFVFASFYGSYYAQTAYDLWENIQGVRTKDGYLVTDILADNGVYNYVLFENHVKKVEGHFWNEKFKVYYRWRKKAWEYYKNNGYIELVTGFRCSGIMRRNQILNIPIQGPAFHCLLWSLIRTSKIAKREKWESKIIGQVHDSIILDVCEDEFDHVVNTVKRVMTEDIRKYWDWIIVPLKVEAEVSKVNGNWYEMKEIDLNIERKELKDNER